jgi:hypothetical protein
MAHSAGLVEADSVNQSQSTLVSEIPAETTLDFDHSAYVRETARKALDDLISRALAYRTGPELKALFDFMKRFPHLALYNAMLLHVQNPHIQFALRAPMWQRKYERRVTPGARPYVILQTMGPVAFAFDLCDTKPITPFCGLVPVQPFVTKYLITGL